MLLEEDPAYLIRTTISHFNTSLDKDAVSRIQDSLASLAQARELRLRDTDSRSKKLSRNLTTLSQQHNDAMLDYEGGEHASEVVELDTKKFRIAKNISDIEVESARLEQEVVGSRTRLDRLQQQGLQGDQHALLTRQQDPSLLGVVPHANFSSAIVRNPTKGDVHVIETIDPSSANRIWDAMA